MFSVSFPKSADKSCCFIIRRFHFFSRNSEESFPSGLFSNALFHIPTNKVMMVSAIQSHLSRIALSHIFQNKALLNKAKNE